MRNIDVLVAWLDGLPHRVRKGHHPIWYDLGAGERTCTNCMKGGGRSHTMHALALLRP